MKREDIEKAARESAEIIANIAYSGGGHLGQDDLETAFENGAEWRINSVWHDASEKPEKSERYILIESISYDGVKCYNVICAKHYTEHPFNERWAYIEDLLPTKEDK